MQYLHKIFFTLKSYNLYFFSKKKFFGYLSVALLKQKIDTLKLATAKNKLAAIIKLAFFKTFKQLKYYLNLIEYLRQYIFYFAAVVRSL